MVAFFHFWPHRDQHRSTAFASVSSFSKGEWDYYEETRVRGSSADANSATCWRETRIYRRRISRLLSLPSLLTNTTSTPTGSFGIGNNKTTMNKNTAKGVRKHQQAIGVSCLEPRKKEPNDKASLPRLSATYSTCSILRTVLYCT